MGYMLETRGLTKRFGRGDQAQDAVADVSLHIREGEVYGLLGPNGAGKSTTLKMICGMLRPTAGEILFAGHAWRREDLYAIGSLIEEAPLYLAPSRSPTAPRAARWPPSRSPCEGLTTQALTPACLAIKRFPDNNARCRDRPG